MTTSGGGGGSDGLSPFRTHWQILRAVTQQMMLDKRKQEVAQFKCTCNSTLTECTQNDQQNWRYKLCNATRHYLFTRCRYPAFTANYIRRHVDRPDTSPEDLQAYLENSSQIRRNKALIIVCVYLTYCLKNLFVPLEMFRMFNYDDLESNIESPHHGTDKYRLDKIKLFTCLATNCSHLSPLSMGGNTFPGTQVTLSSRLATDISKLPMFKLCHPIINSWYSPVTALDSLGVLILLCVSFNAFLLGSWITIQQLIFPAGNEMIMFIVAPAVTARMAWRRTRQLLSSVSSSYAHFCLNSKLRFSTQTEREYLSSSARLVGLESTWSRLKPVNETSQPLGRRQRRRRRRWSATKASGECEQQVDVAERALEPLRSDEELDCMTSECLPIIRTCWWRKAITNIFLSILGVTVSEILILSGFAFKYIKKSLQKKEEQLASFAEEMRRQDCQLWYAAQDADKQSPTTSVAHPAGQRQLIELTRLELKWTVFSRLEGGLFNVMPALGVSMMFAYYWGVISEIEIWLAELRTYLVATLVVSRVKLSQVVGVRSEHQPPWMLCATTARLDAQRPSAFTNGDTPLLSTKRTLHATQIKTKHFYSMPYLRQQFQQEIDFFSMAYFTRMRDCHIRPNDGAVVHASKPAMHDSNEKAVFTMREIRFMEMIDAANQSLATSNRAGSPSLSSSLDLEPEDGQEIDDLEHDVYTMEQVYVNFRLFIEHVHGLAPSMGVVLAITYLLNYGLVCICVMCSRKFADLKTETMFVVVFGWLISNILIVLAANFHANAKKLQPLMWSIIAELTLSQDNRVKHLRFLWLKQAQILDNQGGLALDAFGLRVTYVNIIQIIIWTITIIVMALKS